MGTTKLNLAEKFMEVFAGLMTAHGTYDMSNPKVRDDGKREGSAVTKREPITLEMWERHLQGKGSGLGVVPIRENNDCVFGAIDVDVYPVNHQQIAAQVKRLNLPLILCRSKSGGAHLYLFCKQPVAASMMKSKLSEVAAFMGYGNSEVFPKQTHILVDKGDCGAWINMPYFNGVRGLRYAVDVEGNAIAPADFLDLVEETAVDTEWFSQLLVLAPMFDDGPPCLQTLAQLGYPPGTRNNGLYNIGVYLRKSKPDTWEADLEEHNHQYMSPPLSIPEVQGIIKSLRKKDYTYGCQKQPILQHCNAALCRTREFGVASGSMKFPALGGLSKLDTKPPIWFWTVEGVRMQLSTEEIQEPKRFQRRCMEYINTMPPMPKLEVWQAAVQHAMDSVTIVEAPADASPEGQFWEMVEKFCTGRVQAHAIEEISTGKPFSKDGRTYFRMQDLLTFLTSHKFFEFRSVQIASMLKDAGAQHHFSNFKGRGVNYWSLVEFAKQSEPFDVPQKVRDQGDVF